MNHRERHNLLEQNVKLTKEKSELEEKLTSAMDMLNDKMSQVVELLAKLNEKESVVVAGGYATAVKEDPATKSNPEKPFIPTPDTESLKSNISDIKVKKRESNLSKAAENLRKLQQEEEN